MAIAFGLLMVAAAAVQAGGTAALLAAVAATLAVLAGARYRIGATLAVIGAVVTLALSEPSPLAAALCGLCALAYLVLRHTAAFTLPTVIAASAFTAVGLAATSIPLELPWLPLVAPLAVPGLYLLVVWPFHHEV